MHRLALPRWAVAVLGDFQDGRGNAATVARLRQEVDTCSTVPAAGAAPPGAPGDAVLGSKAAPAICHLPPTGRPDGCLPMRTSSEIST